MADRQGFDSGAAYPVRPSTRSVSGDFTFAESDLAQVVQSTGSSLATATIPADLPVGWRTTLVQNGTGKVLLAGAVGVTLRNASAGLRTTARGAKVEIVGVALNEFVISSPHLEANA